EADAPIRRPRRRRLLCPRPALHPSHTYQFAQTSVTPQLRCAASVGRRPTWIADPRRAANYRQADDLVTPVEQLRAISLTGSPFSCDLPLPYGRALLAPCAAVS